MSAEGLGESALILIFIIFGLLILYAIYLMNEHRKKRNEDRKKRIDKMKL